MSKKILITVGKGGSESTLKTEGFTGGACKIAAQGYKAVLGEVREEEATAEAYACEVVEQHAS